MRLTSQLTQSVLWDYSHNISVNSDVTLGKSTNSACSSGTHMLDYLYGLTSQLTPPDSWLCMLRQRINQSTDSVKILVMRLTSQLTPPDSWLCMLRQRINKSTDSVKNFFGYAVDESTNSVGQLVMFIIAKD